MKVLLVNSVLGFGSTGHICTDLAQALINRGDDVKAAFGRHGEAPGAHADYAMRIGSDKDVCFHGIYSRVTDGHGFASGAATRRFICEAKAFDPDVIHLHNLHGYYLHLPTLAAYLQEAGKPIIWTLHDCWPFTGHCAHYSSVACEKWHVGCGECPNRNGYPSALRDNSLKNYTRKRELFSSLPNLTLVSPSAWLAEELSNSFFRDVPAVVIPNGVDLQRFCRAPDSDLRAKLNVRGGRMILAVSGVWNKEKGLDDLLVLASKLPPEDRLVIVGLTKSQCRHLPANVVGLVHTTQETELVSLYSSADVFLNLTYADTYPTVNLEAIACGTPVITYRSGGSPESASIAVAPGDIDGVLRALEQLDELRLPEILLDRRDMLNAYLRLYDEKAKHACGEL